MRSVMLQINEYDDDDECHYPKMASLLEKWEQALRCYRKYLLSPSSTKPSKSTQTTMACVLCRHRLVLYGRYLDLHVPNTKPD